MQQYANCVIVLILTALRGKRLKQKTYIKAEGQLTNYCIPRNLRANFELFSFIRCLLLFCKAG